MKVTKPFGLVISADEMCEDCAKRLVCLKVQNLISCLERYPGFEIEVKGCSEYFNENLGTEVHKFGPPLPSPYKYVVV